MIFFANPTDVAAWWGAVIATAVLAWQIYVEFWRTGARLRIRMHTNIGIYEDTDADNTYILVRVANNGDRATTITQLGFIIYSTWWRCIRRNETESRYLTPDLIANEYPTFTLAVGDEWHVVIKQEDDSLSGTCHRLLSVNSIECRFCSEAG